MPTPKPFAESCEENKQPILAVLRQELAQARQLLEIGSGTGQHAVFFARHLPQLVWHTSDVVANHAGIRAWLNDDGPANVRPPLALDVAVDPWPAQSFDAVFSANTVHIMGWPEVERMFAGIGQVLQSSGRFCLYGPFNVNGQFTSESNARFDAWLKGRDPNSGIRDQGELDRLAAHAGLRRAADYAMPANNNILVWEKVGAE
jgi:cyclopropane fatty-acyl-phospholipid synthase-like methyltransferase